MKLLQGKPLHVRRRIAAIATGIVGIILLALFIYVYTRPHQVERDPEVSIVTTYTTFLDDVQSYFHHK